MLSALSCALRVGQEVCVWLITIDDWDRRWQTCARHALVIPYSPMALSRRELGLHQQYIWTQDTIEAIKVHSPANTEHSTARLGPGKGDVSCSMMCTPIISSTGTACAELRCMDKGMCADGLRGGEGLGHGGRVDHFNQKQLVCSHSCLHRGLSEET